VIKPAACVLVLLAYGGERRLKRSREISIDWTSLLPPVQLLPNPIHSNFPNPNCGFLTPARLPEPPPLANPSLAASSHAPRTLRPCAPPRPPWRRPPPAADPPRPTQRSRASAIHRRRGIPDLTPPPPMVPRLRPPPSRL
jgi:hypothetical protein